MRIVLMGVAVALASCSPGAADAKRLVREELIDGATARFENVVSGNLLDGRPAVCGWVNGRNSFGAYTGADPFLVVDGRVRSLGAKIEPGYEGAFGACVANDKAASERLYRDADRALSAYEAAVKQIE